MRHMVMAFAALMLLAGGLAKAAPSAASDRNILGRLQRSLDEARPDPRFFDGKQIPATADLDHSVTPHLQKVKFAIQTFDTYWPQLSAGAQASADGQGLKARYEALKPYAAALQAALPAAIAARDKARSDAAAAQKAAAQAQADANAKARADLDAQHKAQDEARAAAQRERAAKDKAAHEEYARKEAETKAQEKRGAELCGKFWNNFGDYDAQKVAARGLHATLQTVDEVKAEKKLLETTAAVCKKPEYATDFATLCGKSWWDSSRGTQVGSILEVYPTMMCDAAADPGKVLAAGIAAAIQANLYAWVTANKPPTVEQLRAEEGWIKTNEPFVFDRDMVFGDAMKKKLDARYKPLYDAAGVKMPDDAYAETKAYFDVFSASVLALAPELTTPGKKCNDPLCGKPKAAIKKWHPKAKILKVNTDLEFSVSDREAAVGGWILYQLPGEKYCQNRAWVLYARSDALKIKLELTYVRVQQCK